MSAAAGYGIASAPPQGSVRVSLELHEISAEILLGSEGVVRAAAKREVRLGVLAAASESRQVVQLEAVRFTAALP